VQKFRQDLERQKVCRHNLTTVDIDSFLDDAESCRRENEIDLSYHNPTLDVSWVDPYADDDVNSTVVEDDEPEAEGFEGRRVPVWNTVQLDCRSDNEAESVFWVTPTNAVFLLRNRTSEEDFCQPNVQILHNACGQVRRCPFY
jgi:hypothetical protein